MPHALVFATTLFVFFFNDTATTEIYTLSLHDALPISQQDTETSAKKTFSLWRFLRRLVMWIRSEEHTSELQSQSNLLCRLLLEKKKSTVRHSYLASTDTSVTPGPARPPNTSSACTSWS